MQTRVITVPDLNQNESIEALSTTVGAYVGAATTAIIGGICTGILGAFRGAVAGGQTTHANAGQQQQEVTNTSQAARMAAQGQQFNLRIAGQATGFSTSPNVLRMPTAPTQQPIPAPVEISERELALIMRLRQEEAATV